jgi:hypothetical protein
MWENYTSIPTYSYTGSVVFVNTPSKLYVKPGNQLVSFNANYQAVEGNIDVRDFTTLEELNLNSCGVNNLQLSGCTLLRTLNAENNSFNSLDVTTCTNLRTLNLNSCGGLTYLTLSGLSLLREVDVETANISNLNLTGNLSLSSLKVGFCSFNNLDALFAQLPDRTSITAGYIAVYENNDPSYDTSIATNKNWVVDEIQ